MESRVHDGVLERMLADESAEPTQLPLSLLEDITDCFSLDHEIGAGGFAVVYKGIIGKEMVAVKKLSNTFPIHENKFHEEVKCLMKAKHKNIIRFLGYCSDAQGEMLDFEGKFVMADRRNWLLCFEYVPNGSLDKHITDASGGLEWKVRYRIIRGICEGLHYLHDKRILHLDLNPANILLDDRMVPKIADFGLSRCFDEGQTRVITENMYGTRGYFAPELQRGQITFGSDMFSLGVIIIEILTGEKSYPEDKKVVEIWMNRLEASEGDMELEQVRLCTKIGMECMELDPKKRPVAQHIIDMLDKTGRAEYSDESDSSSVEQSHKMELPQEKLNESTEENEKVKQRSLSSGDLNMFTELEVKRITDNYSTSIGEGAFEEVHPGVLDDGGPVAVKSLMNYISPSMKDTQLDDEQAWMVAHEMLPFCKHAMAGCSSVDMGPLDDDDLDLDTSRQIFTLRWENMCKVVDMEVSLMYDILYTKAGTVQTVLGYGIRVASPLAIAAAAVLFGLFYSKEGQSIAYFVITYALLAATLLFRALIGSTWTHAFLQKVLFTGRWRWLRHVIVSLDLGGLRLTAHPRSARSYRRSSGTVGQYNLLHECTRIKISARATGAKAIGLEGVWNDSKGNKLLGDDVQRLVFTRVREVLMSTYEDNDCHYTMKDITTSWGQVTAKMRQDKLKRFRLAFGREFQEDILVWHIATQVFLIRSGSDQSLICHDKNAATYAKAITALSEYLMFLMAMRWHMLPGLVLRRLYDVTCDSLQAIWRDEANRYPISNLTTGEERLASILFDKKHADSEWGFQDYRIRLISDAVNLAFELLDANESEMPQLLELVFNVWVDKLLYAATLCSPESHAKQLGRGGDLTTIVWIMAHHAGLFQIGQRGPDAEMQHDEKKRPEE